jgi:hypothetical protein
MPDIQGTANDESAPSDLISFLKAMPDGRLRRGVRPQWQDRLKVLGFQGRKVLSLLMPHSPARIDCSH